MKRLTRPLWAAILMALAIPPSSVTAQSVGGVHVSGLGSWAYGRTDVGRYATGSTDGAYDNLAVALSVASSPADRLRIHSQFFWSQEGEEAEVELDFALAEWSFSDAARFRIGRVKHPFGIYTEIYDVGTARPFTTLPQGIYGGSGFVAEGFLGAGVTGVAALGRDWSLEYDAYGGQLNALFEEPGAEGDEGLEEEALGGEEEEGLAIRDLIGGRINMVAPFAGLRLGVSAYSGTGMDEETSFRHSAGAVHLEGHTVGGQHLRAEAARLRQPDRMEADTWYVELAQDLGANWQATVRYESSNTSLFEEGAEGEEDEVLPFTHGDAAVGLNYRFNANFVMKASLHQVEGYRFAQLPPLDGAFGGSTRLFQLGAQFAF